MFTIRSTLRTFKHTREYTCNQRCTQSFINLQASAVTDID